MLEGRLVRLRPVCKEDYPYLIKWRQNTDQLKLWLTYRHISDDEVTLDEILHDMRQNRHVTFIIERKHDSKPIGMIYSYDLYLVDGHCKVTTFLDSQVKGRGHGFEAHGLFLLYLFDYYNLNKIYADAYEYNSYSLNLMLKAGYVEEGRFPEHRYFQGKSWSMIRLALYRNNYDAIKEKLAKITRTKH